MFEDQNVPMGGDQPMADQPMDDTPAVPADEEAGGGEEVGGGEEAPADEEAGM